MNTNPAISRFSITQQVIFLAGLFLAGFTIFISLSAYTISKTSVNGPIYGQIIQGKDLVADILPPPEYIIESYLVCFQALEENQTALEGHVATFTRLHKEFNERQIYWKKELADGEAKKLLTGDAAIFANNFFTSAEKRFFPALKKGDNTEARRVMQEVLTPQYTKHRNIIDRIVTITNNRNEVIEKEATQILSSFRWTMSIVAIVVIAISIFISLLIIRSIHRTISFCADITNRVAKGDLTVSIPVEGRGSIRILLQSLNTMTSHLRGIVTQVSSTTLNLTSESEKLHAASQYIASGSKQVASEIAGFASTTSGLSATSQDISTNCSSVASSSIQTMDIAETSTAVVQETINRMHGIANKVKETSIIIDQLGERSEQIGQIIETIEDIADQTNLLALNAAIEAARAGEMGRGFAVVADEVRALAERTTRATREITGMIDSIQHDTRNAVACMEEGVHEVERGNSASLRSGEALNSIRNKVGAVTDQISQIATAAEQQTSATTEIDDHVRQIDEAIRRTSQETHSVAQSAAELAEMTLQLRRLVESFAV